MGEDSVVVQLTDFTSTSFGLIMAFLLPGLTALFSLTFWVPSAARAFHTFLTSNSNAGLFVFLILAATTLGLVISSVRWVLFECLLKKVRLFGIEFPSQEERKRMSEPDRFAAFRAAIDEGYRYHQFFGGMAIATPALFAGWVGGLNDGRATEVGLIVSFVALELLLATATMQTLKRHLAYVKNILAQRED